MTFEERQMKWKELDSYIAANYFQILEESVEDTPKEKAIPRRTATPRKRNCKLSLKQGSMPSMDRTLINPDLDKKLKEMEETFQQMLFRLIDEKELKDSTVYNKANIDKRLFSKIRSDMDYHPSKNTVIQLCLGLSLEIDTALDLLKKAGYTLSQSRMEDVVIRYFIEKRIYDVLQINEALYDYDLPLLIK
jgi:hypothetical protein